jgi:two-component system, OmpR family, KDP operon response regulator KdpE
MMLPIAMQPVTATTRQPAPRDRRVLACDDEPRILRALKVILRTEGYAVVTAENANEALNLVAVAPVDAAIVDLLLPDRDGLELCRRLREWSEMPIIVLSAVGDDEQKVAALKAGADDYITKPFGPRELLARLEAVLRRVSPEAEHRLIVAAGLEIDLAAHVVRHDGDEVHLTPTEFELLRVLVCNRGRLMTHRALLTEVWGHGYADDNQVLRTHIARLRRKIDPPDGATRHPIRTEPGVGFRFDPR